MRFIWQWLPSGARYRPRFDPVWHQYLSVWFSASLKSGEIPYDAYKYYHNIIMPLQSEPPLFIWPFDCLMHDLRLRVAIVAYIGGFEDWFQFNLASHEKLDSVDFEILVSHVELSYFLDRIAKKRRKPVSTHRTYRKWSQNRSLVSQRNTYAGFISHYIKR